MQPLSTACWHTHQGNEHIPAYFSRAESFTKATHTSLTEEMIILMLPRLRTEFPLACGTHSHTQLHLGTTMNSTQCKAPGQFLLQN